VISKFETDDSSPRLLEINDSVWISSSSVGGASASIDMPTEMVVVSAFDGLNVGELVGADGIEVGTAIGNTEGRDVGGGVEGRDVGRGVGKCEGLGNGAELGIEVGAPVGQKVPIMFPSKNSNSPSVATSSERFPHSRL